MRPVKSISKALFRPTALDKGTAGVEQNSPILTPGVPKEAPSSATTRSQAATNWQPRGCGYALHLGDYRLGDVVDQVHQADALFENVPVESGLAVGHFLQIVPGTKVPARGL